MDDYCITLHRHALLAGISAMAAFVDLFKIIISRLNLSSGLFPSAFNPTTSGIYLIMTSLQCVKTIIPMI